MPSVLLVGIFSENMLNQAYTKIWAVSGQTTACGRAHFFFTLHLILGGIVDICGPDCLQRNCPPFA